jgi:hypothetical protein
MRDVHVPLAGPTRLCYVAAVYTAKRRKNAWVHVSSIIEQIVRRVEAATVVHFARAPINFICREPASVCHVRYTRKTVRMALKISSRAEQIRARMR